MDFTWRRTENGPGYSVSGKETEDFDLEEDAGFGEQTAVIYHIEKEYISAQYNHLGPRANDIAHYFSQFSTGASQDYFDWIPELDEEVRDWLHRSSVQTQLVFKLDTASLNENSTRDTAISSFLEMRQKNAAGMIEVTLSCGEDRRGGPLSGLLNLIENLLSQGNALKKMQAKIKEQPEDSAELLDLLGHKLVEEIDENLLEKTDGLRYSFESRISFLERALNQWLQSR